MLPKTRNRETLRMLFAAVLLAFVMLLPGASAQAKVTSTSNIPTVTGGRFVHSTSKNIWRYKFEDGTYLKDTLANIDGKIYYFAANKSRLSGFQTIGENTYYFGKPEEGFMYRSKWLQATKTKAYFFRKNGVMARKQWLTIGKKQYYFNVKGVRYYGLHTIGGKTYFFGTYKEGWLYKNTLVKYKGNIYYIGEDGTITKGRYTMPNGDVYHFDDQGHALTGSQVIDDIPYTFSSTGVLLHIGPDIEISSDCALMQNVHTGTVVFSKNAQSRHANASTTKILTCILALENAKLSDTVEFSEYAASMIPTKLYASPGEKFRLRDLMYSLMVPSHNDTAVAIAEHVSGTEKKFVSLMNKKAAEIGCTNTHFATPSGLDDDVTHYTTAEDLAKIAIYAYKKSAFFRKLIQTTIYSFYSKDGYFYYVTTTNKFLAEQMPGIIGMKTGYTSKAGHCFVGVVKTKKDNTYVTVTLGGSTSEERWEDSEALLKYAYDNL